MKPFRQLILVSLITLFLTPTAWASLFNSELTYTNRVSHINAALGFHGGGFGLGGEYEYMLHRDFSIGGMARFYTGGDNGNPEVINFAAFYKAHFPMRSWEIYVAPGLGLTRMKLDNIDGDITLTPQIAIGTMMTLTEGLNIGIENLNIINSFGSEDAYRGTVINDWMIKVQIIL